MSESLHYLTATEALKMFRSREISPLELMRAVIARSEACEPKINAFSHTYFEQALDAARASEARYARGEPCGVLDGLPLGMKDEIEVAGQPVTEGSLLYEHRIAQKDAVLVERLRSAGAIFHARTTCPEFCSLWNTQSRLFGVTRNPWNLDITPGGSSGGSGAALAAGTAMLATGSDIGGSIRFPASMSGVVGFKPPYGRVPETMEPFNLESYCANGPMARTVAGTALMQNVISGAHPADAASRLPKVDIPLSFPDQLDGTRIAYTLNFDYMDIEDDVARNTLDAIERLRGLGAELVEVQLDFPAGIERAYYGHMDPMFFASIAGKLEQHSEMLCDYNIQMAKDAMRRLEDKAAFYEAALVESQMYARFGTLMEEFDVLVCPTVLTNRMAADFNPAKDDYIVKGEVKEFDLSVSTCHLFNMMGRCPAISVPSGIGDNGVPTGLQIASKAYDDVAVFRVAAAFESTWERPFRPE
ncbi:MAG: amidase [Deltaproteobacteria bacterium]|jgi:Asp-tRNA(Asn)/Glu-tRNA(Gln) amidotransferase A subunit family amidase|nr:amidase [Deltaproteobacteria bacterium]